MSPLTGLALVAAAYLLGMLTGQALPKAEDRLLLEAAHRRAGIAQQRMRTAERGRAEAMTEVERLNEENTDLLDRLTRAAAGRAA